MKRTHDVKPKEGAVARALEDALALKKRGHERPCPGPLGGLPPLLKEPR